MAISLLHWQTIKVMNTTVELKVSIDIEEVYDELSCADQEQFLVNHATDIAG